MIKKNTNLIKFIICSLTITSMIKSNVNAINSFESKKIKSNSVFANIMESEEEKRAKLSQEYNDNKFLKDFVDSVIILDKTFKQKSHEEQLATILDINQKLQLAKNSNTLSKEALNFINEIINDLEPTYSNFLNEAKAKHVKPNQLPKKQKDDMEPNQLPEKQKDNINLTPKDKQEKAKEKIEKHLPKTGSILDNNLFLQIGTTASLLGVYIIKNTTLQ